MTKEQTNSWEDEFDFKWGKCGAGLFEPTGHTNPWEIASKDRIKDFISKTISQEKENMLEEVKKEIKEKELRLAKMETGRQWMRGWNECREKIINLLQNK